MTPGITGVVAHRFIHMLSITDVSTDIRNFFDVLAIGEWVMMILRFFRVVRAPRLVCATADLVELYKAVLCGSKMVVINFRRLAYAHEIMHVEDEAFEVGIGSFV